METTLTLSVSIDALLARRDALVARLTAAHQLLQEVNQLSTAAFGRTEEDTRPLVHLEDRSRHLYFTEPDSLPQFIAGVDAEAWDYLLSKSGLRTFMDAAARQKWDEQIAERKVPELTRENITATFELLHQQRGEMLERGVVNLFRSLSWDYKTNTPHKLSKRIIVRHAVNTWTHRSRTEVFGVHHDAANKFDDILRIFRILDGKPEFEYRHGAHQTLSALKWPKECKHAQLHELITVKGFQNGNAHVTFLREDLIDRCNQIIAKHFPNALPPATEP